MPVAAPGGEVSGKVGHLLAFFVAATQADSVFAVRPDAGALDALYSGVGVPGAPAAAVHTVDDTADVPADARVVFLGPGVTWVSPPPAALTISTSRDATPDAPPWVVASARIGPAHAAPGLWLTVMSAGLSDLVRDTIVSIGAASRAKTPTQPMPPDAGQLLHVLALGRRATRIFEVGTSTGAAALWLASALAPPKGRLTSIERDSARHTLAQRNVKRAGLEGVVRLHLGEAERWLPRLSGSADLLLLDDDPSEWADHFMAILGRLRSGALVVAHGGTEEPAAVARYKAFVRTLPEAVATVSVAAGHGLSLTLLATRPQASPDRAG